MNYTDKLACRSQYEQMGLACQADFFRPTLYSLLFSQHDLGVVGLSHEPDQPRPHVQETQDKAVVIAFHSEMRPA
jgi:hypothetical protein